MKFLMLKTFLWIHIVFQLKCKCLTVSHKPSRETMEGCGPVPALLSLLLVRSGLAFPYFRVSHMHFPA